ncbi:MAG: hypothetical protein QM503_10130 [Bacteroidota bacterium]
MDNKEQIHYYLLPDKRTARNMKEACEMMELGPQGFRALVRKGVVKKVTTSKTEWYEDGKKANPKVH